MTTGVLLRFKASDVRADFKDLQKINIEEAPGRACAYGLNWHPRCEEAILLNWKSVAYENASTAVFIASCAVAAGTISYALYKADRIRIAPTLGGFVGSYTW